jgi:peptidoglycan/LPS O-acetylase OafA/YrhL
LAWDFLSKAPWLLFLTVALLTGSALLENQYGADYRDSLGFIFNPLLTAALIPQLIAHRERWFVAWMQFRPVTYLGGISYSLYLYQQMVLHPAGQALSRFPLFVQLVGSVAAVIVVASASYQFIEKPFLRWKDRAFHA